MVRYDAQVQRGWGRQGIVTACNCGCATITPKHGFHLDVGDASLYRTDSDLKTHGPALMNAQLETEGCFNGVQLWNLTGKVHTTIRQRHFNFVAPNSTCHSLQGDGWLITGTCAAQTTCLAV